MASPLLQPHPTRRIIPMVDNEVQLPLMEIPSPTYDVFDLLVVVETLKLDLQMIAGWWEIERLEVFPVEFAM